MSKEKQIQEYENKQLIDELSKMPPMVIATAYLDVINYTMYGEDVTEKWLTATQNASALEKAYRQGYHDAIEEYLKENGEWNTVTCDLNKVPSVAAKAEQQWIPCSERPPEEGHDVLITKEPFKIKGYEQEVIKAKRSIDPRSGKIEWWSPEFGTLTNKAVLAWMPLPEPYREEGEADE